MEKDLCLAAAEEVIELIPIMQNNFTRKFSSNTEISLTTLQLDALKIIEETGPLPMNIIAARLSMSKQQLTRFVENLVAKGYLERQHMANNRRTIYISITGAGQEILKKHYAERLALHAADFRKLTEAQLQQVHDGALTLRKILSSV